MGDTSNYDRTGDDFLSNYDFMYFPRSSSDDALARLENLSSHGRIKERYTKNRKQIQQSFAVPVNKKEINVDLPNSSAVAAIEGTMKKYADNLLRVLEGMNARLSQLESSVFTLNHSMGDLKVSVTDSYGKFDVSLRSLSNDFTDVQRAMQLLRDKQEIIETNAELVKLQLSENNTIEDSSPGSFVAGAQASSGGKFSAHVQGLSSQHGPSALATFQEPQQLQSNQLTLPVFQQSVVPQTDMFAQVNIQTSLPLLSSSVQPLACFTGTSDMQQSQPLQGLHPSTQHVLQMQSFHQQPQLQQPPFLPQQPVSQEAQHRLQQTNMLQPSPQLSHVKALQSMHVPLQHDQSIQENSQTSSPVHSIQSPKTYFQAQQGPFSETQMHQSGPYLSSQGVTEAHPFISHSQNLPMPAAYGTSQVAVQPANVFPKQQHSQGGAQIYDYYHRVVPSFPPVHRVHDSQQGRHAS